MGIKELYKKHEQFLYKYEEEVSTYALGLTALIIILWAILKIQ